MTSNLTFVLLSVHTKRDGKRLKKKNSLEQQKTRRARIAGTSGKDLAHLERKDEKILLLQLSSLLKLF